MAAMKTPRNRSAWPVLGVLALCLVIRQTIFVDPIVDDTAEGHGSPKEDAIIEAIRKAALHEIAQAARTDGETKRDAHPAPHGCVKAYFEVRRDLPADLAHGVLQPGAEYPAWVRFSNGLFADDNESDARGMAIKLMEVPGPKLLPGQAHEGTQDFVMINNPTFPIADPEEFLRFFELQVKGDTMGYFIGWNPLQWHLREMRVGFGMLERPANPLSTAYFSMLPYRLGPHAIKFSAQPCDPEVLERCEPWDEPVPGDRTSHYLRDAMVASLTPKAAHPEARDAAARFVFRVQRQIPHANMPIEDASIEWSQTRSPYVPVATLRIPAQRFSSAEQNGFCEQLSFNPWHALPQHEPIGGLNRARRVLYDAVSAARHAANGVPRHEPRGHCLRLDGHDCEQQAELGGLP